MAALTRQALINRYGPMDEAVISLLLPHLPRREDGSVGGESAPLVHTKRAGIISFVANGGSAKLCNEDTRTTPLLVSHDIFTDIDPEDWADFKDVVGIDPEVAEIMDHYKIEDSGSFLCPSRNVEDH